MIKLKKWTKFLGSPLFVGIVITVLCAVTSYRYFLWTRSKSPNAVYNFLDLVHAKSIDWRLLARGFRAPGPDVAILAVDEKAVEQIARWPWSRDKIAHVIETLHKYGAKALAFDMVFAERDQNSSGPTLSRLRKLVFEKKLSASPEMISALDTEIIKSNTDGELAKMIAKYPDMLIMGSYFDKIDDLSPHLDACWDFAFSKTPIFRGWDKEATKIIVNDTRALSLPEAWIPIVDSQLKGISVETATSWMQQNPGALSDAADFLTEKYNFALTDDEWPMLISMYNEHDVTNLQTLVSEKAPNKQWSDDELEQIFVDLGPFLGRARIELLQKEIYLNQLGYCEKFLGDKDPLLEEFEKTWDAVQSSDKELAGLSFQDGIQRFKRTALKSSVSAALNWWMNLPELTTASTHNGYFNAFLDEDGTIRRSRLIARSGNQYMMSMGLRTFLQVKGLGALATIERNPGNEEEKSVSELRVIDAEGQKLFDIPIDHQSGMMINFAGPQYSFPYLSVADLMDDKDDATIKVLRKKEGSHTAELEVETVKKAEFIKDKVFVFGATAIGIYDLRLVPFQKEYAGVETHANIIDNLLRQDFLRIYEDDSTHIPAFILIFGLILSFLLAHLSAIPSMLAAVSGGALIYFFDRYYFFANGRVTTIILPIFALALLFLGVVSYKYFTEERKKKEIKGTFQKYVSPAVVNEILADPSNLELGGRKETITVFFSDVRGFTTISEKLDPRALSDLLNSYLTPMTRLVFDHKGTLDKYMGDAIMAFFGAPIHYSDHAKHACRCALSHLTKLKELQAEYERKGLPTIDIGIGLNTGEASVGNMGSDIVRNYTVMGDTVNLASRLEGINKQYGTRIIISEFTRAMIGEDFTVREVDWVRVKGKAQPVKIFELVAEGPVPAEHLEMLKWFNEGFLAYHNLQFQTAMEHFTKSLNIKPDDECSQLYIERCTEYLAEPPPEGWDGAYTMKTK